MSKKEIPPVSSTTIEALVEEWFFEAFHGSLVARSTEVWNAVHAAKEELKQRLVTLMTPAA